MADRGAIGAGPVVAGSASSVGSGGVSYAALVMGIVCGSTQFFTTPSGQASGLPLVGPPSLAAQLTGGTFPPPSTSGAVGIPPSILGSVSQPPGIGQ